MPGCIYLGDSAPDARIGEARDVLRRRRARAATIACASAPEMRGIAAGDARDAARAVGIAGEPTPDMPVDDERWKVPPSLGVMLQPLETLHRPSGSLYRAVHRRGARRRRDRRRAIATVRTGSTSAAAPVDVGFSIDLTIDPSLQALAQQTAACYTGRQDVCRALGIARKEDGGAGDRASRCSSTRWCAWPRSRSSTSRAAASRRSPARCRRARARNTTGRAASAHCDKRLPYPIRYRPDALLNPAVFHDAMPASMIKPIMAAAFLSDPAGRRALARRRARRAARSPTALPSPTACAAS